MNSLPINKFLTAHNPARADTKNEGGRRLRQEICVDAWVGRRSGNELRRSWLYFLILGSDVRRGSRGFMGSSSELRQNLAAFRPIICSRPVPLTLIFRSSYAYLNLLNDRNKGANRWIRVRLVNCIHRWAILFVALYSRMDYRRQKLLAIVLQQGRCRALQAFNGFFMRRLNRLCNKLLTPILMMYMGTFIRN
jgi:hypothetical protein